MANTTELKASFDAFLTKLGQTVKEGLDDLAEKGESLVKEKRLSQLQLDLDELEKRKNSQE